MPCGPLASAFATTLTGKTSAVTTSGVAAAPAASFAEPASAHDAGNSLVPLQCPGHASPLRCAAQDLEVCCLQPRVLRAGPGLHRQADPATQPGAVFLQRAPSDHHKVCPVSLGWLGGNAPTLPSFSASWGLSGALHLPASRAPHSCTEDLRHAPAQCHVSCKVL